MDADKVSASYKAFQDQNPGFGALIVLTRVGDILYTSEPDAMSPDQAKHLVDVWFNNKPAVEFGDIRYPVLKWDELQFAAKNVAKKGSLIGCKTKTDNFAVVKVAGDCPTNIIQATIALNRWSWNEV
jgi:hypothetical protein